jgi:hypothetical protein
MNLKLARAKTAHIPEPNRAKWLAQTRHSAVRLGQKTTGSDSLDRQLDLDYATRTQERIMDEQRTDVECRCCDKPIGVEFFVGYSWKSRHWVDLCSNCHRTDGIGAGPGRAQRYKLVCDTRTRELYYQKVSE